MKNKFASFLGSALIAAMTSVTSAGPVDGVTCDLSDYKAMPGLSATNEGNVLVVTWDGQKDEEIRLRLGVEQGTPKIQDMAVRHKGAAWAIVAANLMPEYRVISGLRRIGNEALEPLRQLGINITPEVLARDRWEAFWDAPLSLPGLPTATSLGNASPPKEGVADQPGLPRKPEEIKRASAVFQVKSCSVKTNGGRIEISYPGVQLGVFDGQLQYTIYKGTNLVRQEVLGKTEQKWVAYKYEAGVKGVSINPGARVVWKDIANNWQDYRFGGAINETPMVLQTASRVVVAESRTGSIAAFPPPHNFFWSREIDVNLGYNYYRKDSATSYAFGVREADAEMPPEYAGRGRSDYRENFALRSARPGTVQHMPVFLYVTAENGQAAAQAAFAFTHGDHYKAVPGYQVMANHFHTALTRRYEALGFLHDFQVAKAAGVNIFAPIDGDGGAQGGGAERLKGLDDYYKIARLYSDKNFIMMPNEEIAFGQTTKIGRLLGGHNDLFVSHPVYWTATREPNQPLVEEDPKYGRLYHIGTPADLMEMAHREDLILYMPHPRSKASNGFPDGIKDTQHFRDANYRGIGFRWGMGVDGSEIRLCEYRCQAVLDDMNNWIADLPTPPKYVEAISEVYQQEPGDDMYANTPVNYVKLAELPGLDNWKPVVDAMRRGEYFVTSGEVLIPSYTLQGTGDKRTIVADVEWTFPLDFVEVVWGDGQKTERQIISTTDLTAFGKHHFTIPFSTAGKKWVRFAAWDSAGNGAMVQPIKLLGPATGASTH
jgi:hypothetical protein